MWNVCGPGHISCFILWILMLPNRPWSMDLTLAKRLKSCLKERCWTILYLVLNLNSVLPWIVQSPSLPVHQMFQAFGVTTPEEYVCEVLKRTRSRFVLLLFASFPLSILCSPHVSMLPSMFLCPNLGLKSSLASIGAVGDCIRGFVYSQLGPWGCVVA